MAYSSLLSSGFQNSPNFKAWVDTLCEPMATNAALLASLPQEFDVRYAVGQQLDYTGQWIGVTRYVELPVTGDFFQFDTVGEGWDQAPWYSVTTMSTTRVQLNDDDYRTLLVAKIANNHWDGSTAGAYRIWQVMYPFGSPYLVFVHGDGLMHMLTGVVPLTKPLTPIVKALVSSGKLSVKPVGVGVQYVYPSTTDTTPLFAFDTVAPGFGGWDTGAWGIVT